MPFLRLAWSALTSKVAGPCAMALAAALAIALIVQTSEKASARRQLTLAQNTVSQLQGTLEFQNLAVQEIGKKSIEIMAKAQALVAGARAAHSGDGARIAALLAQPVPHEPSAACEAADQTIRQFFNPQPAGAP